MRLKGTRSDFDSLWKSHGAGSPMHRSPFTSMLNVFMLIIKICLTYEHYLLDVLPHKPHLCGVNQTFDFNNDNIAYTINKLKDS